MRAIYALDFGVLTSLRSFAIHITYAEIIGFSNLFLCSLLPDAKRLQSSLWRQIYLTGEFTVASVIGTFLAMWVTGRVTGAEVPRVALAQFVLIIVSFSLLAAYGIYFYLQMKERLQNTDRR
jgi:hypothetical protein